MHFQTISSSSRIGGTLSPAFSGSDAVAAECDSSSGVQRILSRKYSATYDSARRTGTSISGPSLRAAPPCKSQHEREHDSTRGKCGARGGEDFGRVVAERSDRDGDGEFKLLVQARNQLAFSLAA